MESPVITGKPSNTPFMDGLWGLFLYSSQGNSNILLMAAS